MWPAPSPLGVFLGTASKVLNRLLLVLSPTVEVWAMLAVKEISIVLNSDMCTQPVCTCLRCHHRHQHRAQQRHVHTGCVQQAHRLCAHVAVEHDADGDGGTGASGAGLDAGRSSQPRADAAVTHDDDGSVGGGAAGAHADTGRCSLGRGRVGKAVDVVGVVKAAVVEFNIKVVFLDAM
ncbi:unnamed protein product [Phytophthora lilii]|uniref:Unnamed protein product n=1 Tax=Phytophthora lilii TaxID=2077276 RepID=A0A9W6TZR8_9STRA|nr:unnamed protein product [Phytophthora lilii]